MSAHRRFVIHRAAAIIGLVTLILFPSPGHTTTVVKLSDDELVAISRVVVEGRVTGTHCEWSSDHSQIQTVVTIEVDRSLKGTAGNELELRLMGGQMDDLAMRVSGQPHFTPGEDVVLFIRKGNWSTLPIAGMQQGKLTIVADPATGKRMIAERGVTLESFVGKITKLVATQATQEGQR